MDLQLNDRVALVAGSSRGIGKAIASSLLREGCKVCLTGRDEAAVYSACQDFRPQFEDRLLGFAGDLTEAHVIETTFKAVNRIWGGPDILVANLGGGSGTPGWQLEDAEWERLFNLNFFGSVRLAQAAIPYMQSNGGNILFIGSIAGVESSAAPLPYSSAKAALLNYSKNLSRALSAKRIRVNCLCPGNVLFPGGSWDRHLNNRRKEVEDYISTEVPEKRFGTPEEIADFATYLVSALSDFATGGCYIVDGGQTRSI
jgi:3-oxoacyl-[acyl-carrier protein] reductase